MTCYETPTRSQRSRSGSTLLIQRANRRDTLALHAKLDDAAFDNDARSELTRLDEKEPEEIEIHRDAEVKKAGPDRR